MKKSDAITVYGEGSSKKLAEILGVSKQAVSNWPGEHIPERHALRLKYEIKVPKRTRNGR